MILLIFILTIIFIFIDVYGATITTEQAVVVTKSLPKITASYNLFWNFPTNTSAVSVRTVDDESLDIITDCDTYSTIKVKDKVHIEISKGWFTGIIWNIKIIGKLYL